MDEDDLSTYDNVKNELDEMYDDIGKGMQIRNKCDWHEHGKKSTNFFLNLEKNEGLKTQLKKMLLMIKKLQSKHIF